MESKYIKQSDDSETKIEYFVAAIKDEAAGRYFKENTQSIEAVKEYAYGACDVCLTECEAEEILNTLVTKQEGSR